MKYLYSIIFILAIPVFVFSQDDDIISPERPGITNPPATVPKKILQIESGFNFESDKIKDTDIKTDNYLYPTTLIRYGLLKNIELRLQVDIAGVSVTTGGNKSKQSGLNPVIIGTKVYICKQNKLRPESAIICMLTLPYIGKEGFRPQYAAPNIGFYFQNTLNKKWILGYNLGLQWNGSDANPQSYIAISPTYLVSKKVGVFIEEYSYFQKGSVPDFRSDAGIYYTPLNNLQLDIYGGPGIAGPKKNYFVSAGISLRLPK